MSRVHYALSLAPVHAEVGGYPELVHGHGVHGREVSLHQLHAPLVVVADAEVLQVVIMFTIILELQTNLREV